MFVTSKKVRNIVFELKIVLVVMIWRTTSTASDYSKLGTAKQNFKIIIDAVLINENAR
jgi:hypothetical protein